MRPLRLTLILLTLAAPGLAAGSPSARGPAPASPRPLSGAQQSAPAEGRTVFLNPDGTWLPVEGLDGAAGEAFRALSEGDLERAHELIGTALFRRYLDEAQGRIAERDGPGAMARLDQAARIEPRDEGLQLLRGEALLLLGEEGIAQGQQGLFTLSAFEDALEAYRRAGRSPAARLGMSRAAYLLNRSDEAARYARLAERTAAESASGMPSDGPNGTSGARVVADALYLAYADEAQRAIDRVPEADPEREQALFEEVQSALDALIATEPDGPATWTLGVNLMLFRAAARDDASARQEALALLESGLDRNPTDPALVDRLVGLARGAGGLESSVAALERQLERAPRVGSTVQTLGVELFELGMRDFPGTDSPVAEVDTAVERFRAAEAQLARIPTGPDGDGERVQGLDPVRAYGDAATANAWRIVCRLAGGWVHYWAGDLDAATAAFTSTEELAANGLDVFLPDRLSSARVGLENVVAKYVELEDLISAAAVADLLHARYPQDANLANNAGFLNRDAATGLENLAQAYCRAARGPVDPTAEARLLGGLELETEPGDEEVRRALFAERAASLLNRARRTMRRSGSAYREAARLAPEDLRVQNDTALVYVYYLHTDLDEAERQLLESVRLGEAQLASADASRAAAEGSAAGAGDAGAAGAAAGDLDEQQRYELENAWGDAHENLGVLALEHRADPDAAEQWFQRAVEIGPDPRPIVSEYWLARVAAAKAGETLEPSMVALWGQPCN